MSISPSVFVGSPLKHRAFSVYPPTIGDMLEDYLMREYLRIFTISQEDIWDDRQERGLPSDKDCPTPFDILIVQSGNPGDPASHLIRTGLEKLTRESVIVSPEHRIILFKSEGWEQVEDLQDARCIADNETYFDFQNMVRQAFGEEIIPPPEVEENPRLAALKAKMRQSKRLLKTAKRPDGLSFSTSLNILCHLGLGLNPINLRQLPYASVGPLIEMGINKERFMIDSIALATHADPKKIKPKSWIKNPDD